MTHYNDPSPGVKRTLLILTACLLSLHGLTAQERIIIDWDYEGMSFSEFAVRTESIHPFKFFYKDEWVRDLQLGSYGDNIPLTDLLDRLFYEKALYYFRDNQGNFVITRNFTVRVSDSALPDSGSLIPPSVYYETRDAGELSGNLFREIGNPAERNRPGTVVVSGYITDSDTREPVAGATVFVRKLSAGTLSNQYGFYSLTLPRGIHTVQFSFVGMKETLVDLNLYGEGEMNIEMKSTLIPLKEAVVSADRSVALQRPEVGMEKMTVATLRLTPANMGEANIINSFLLMPGVQSVGEGSAGFNVRGGSADQNLILLYGAPLYNSSHFFGFFSAVNSDIIKDATLYKGGIPARYGGRTSSVLDIGARDGDRNAFAGNAGISPVTTHLMVEGPIIKDTLFYLLAGRTTYSNWVFKVFDNEFLNKSRPSFYYPNGTLLPTDTVYFKDAACAGTAYARASSPNERDLLLASPSYRTVYRVGSPTLGPATAYRFDSTSESVTNVQFYSRGSDGVCAASGGVYTGYTVPLVPVTAPPDHPGPLKVV